MTDGADAGKSGMANYEDPNCNVSLPVFSIHGNHDDPAGEANSVSYTHLTLPTNREV